MPEPVLRVAAALLGVTFAWAALAKLVAWRNWGDALRAYDLPGASVAVARPVVPVLEGAVTALVIAGRTHAAGALTIVLLSSFSGALLHAHSRHGDRLPCGCFGRATTRDYRLMLWRNAALGVLAAVLLVAPGDVSIVDDVSLPRGSDLVPAVLVLVGVVLCVWTAWRAVSSLGRK
jgi:hypothetical protein